MMRKTTKELAWITLGLAVVLGAPGDKPGPKKAADGSAAIDESRGPTPSSGPTPLTEPQIADMDNTLPTVPPPWSLAEGDVSREAQSSQATLQQANPDSDGPSFLPLFQNSGNPTGGVEVLSDAFDDMLDNILPYFDPLPPDFADNSGLTYMQIEQPQSSVILGTDQNAGGGESLTDSSATERSPSFLESLASDGLPPGNSEVTPRGKLGMSEDLTSMHPLYQELLQRQESWTDGIETGTPSQPTQSSTFGSGHGAVDLGSLGSLSEPSYPRREKKWGGNRAEYPSQPAGWTGSLPSFTLSPKEHAEPPYGSPPPVSRTFTSPMADQLSAPGSPPIHQALQEASGSTIPATLPGTPVPKATRHKSARYASPDELRQSTAELERTRSTMLQAGPGAEMTLGERKKRQNKLDTLLRRIRRNKLRLLLGDRLIRPEAYGISEAILTTVPQKTLYLESVISAAQRGDWLPGIAYFSRQREASNASWERQRARQQSKPEESPNPHSENSQSREEGQGTGESLRGQVP